MALKVWMFLLAMTLPDVSPKIILSTFGGDVNNNTMTDRLEPTDMLQSADISNEKPIAESKVVSVQGEANDMCLARLENALGAISQNRMNSAASLPVIDLTGYALHQPLKTVPVDMYVTDLRVKTPSTFQWARIDKCRFDPATKILQARLYFNDLVVTAAVKLMDEGQLKQGSALDAVTDSCNMTLRLRQAGLGFIAVPQHVRPGAVGIRTSATFVDPNFISIHAYNCQPVDVPDQRRSSTLLGGGGGGAFVDGPEGRAPSNEDISQEMEDIFLRGIRSLLTKYMEKQLQPALKDTLMMNMGYTLSYGRK